MAGSHAPRPIVEGRYHEAAIEYLRYLREERPEHFMEATVQATQCKITVASFELVQARRPDVQMFNELLVQYPNENDEIQRIVPDNMVIVHPEPLGELLSFNWPAQAARPFWVFEYVSKGNRRKDYEESFDVYQALHIPYYLIYYPDTEDLSLFRLNSRKSYSSVKTAWNGRYPIPPLDMEVEILNGWVRYWYQGNLLPLPGDLLHQVDALEQQLQAERQATERERQRAERERQRAEQESERANRAEEELAQLRALLGQKSRDGSGTDSTNL